MLGVHDVDAYIELYIPHIICQVVLTGDLTTYRVLAKSYPGLIFNYDSDKEDYDFSLSSLLESNPLILYRILMSDSIQR